MQTAVGTIGQEQY